MWGTSDFRFIGTICSDCVVSVRNENVVAKFAIATKVKFSKQGTCRFPVMAFGDVARIAQQVCRIGARVAVKGTLVSQDCTDPNTGYTSVRVFFYAFEIFLISKPSQKPLSAYERRFSELTRLAPIDPLNLHKKR